MLHPPRATMIGKYHHEARNLLSRKWILCGQFLNDWVQGNLTYLMLSTVYLTKKSYLLAFGG